MSQTTPKPNVNHRPHFEMVIGIFPAKFFIRFSGVIAAVFFAAVPVRSEVIFDADFSSLEKAGNQWKNLGAVIEKKDVACRDGGMEIKTAGAGDKAYTLKPEVDLPSTFSVEFKATVLERSGKDNHFSLTVDGVRIVVRQWGLVCLKDGTSSQGRYGGIGNNQEHSFLIESCSDSIKVYGNGTLLHKVEKSHSATGSLGISFYNINVLLKDFKVYRGERSQETITANLLRNSSFETIHNNLPDYWGTSHWGISAGSPWVTKMDELRRRWRIDQTVAFEGKNSFRIEATDEPRKNYGLILYSCYPGLREKDEYTFSVYLKSDRDEMPVRFGPRWAAVASGQGSAKVGKEWRRYSVSFKCEKQAGEQVLVAPEGKGTLWIDAVQLEEGSQASAYAPHGSKKAKAASAIADTPQLSIPKTERAPILDGNLDDSAWKIAARGQMVNVKKGEPLTDKTDFCLVRDEYNLYIAVECFDRQMDKLVANVKRDKGQIWYDDDIELFFKPDESGGSYYQFALNSLGFKYEGKALGDLSWNAEWRVKVRRGEKSWVAEIAVPFSTLGMEAEKPSVVFNLCRSNPKSKEDSAWSPTGGSFLRYEKWGRLALGNPVGGIFASDLQLSKPVPTSGLHEFSTRLVNNSGQNINGKLTLAINTGEQNVRREQDVQLQARSSAPIVFPGLELPDRQPCRITLSCRSGNDLLLTKTDELETLPVVAVTPEFSYFSDEKEMCFSVDINGNKRPEGLKLRYRLFRGAQQVLEQTQAIPDGGIRTVIAIPNRFGLGNLRLSSELFDASQKLLGKSEEGFAVLAHVENEGKVNLWRRSIWFAGKEVFLWGNLIESWPDENYIGIMAAAGFNNLWYLGTHLPASEEIRNCLELCRKYDVSLIISAGQCDQRNQESIDRLIQAAPLLNRQPAVLAFNALDETASKRMTEAEVDNINQRVRQVIGEHSLVFHNENDLGVMQKRRSRDANIMSVDHYTVPERELASVSLVLESLKKLAGNRPTCFVAQSSGNAYFYGREPTPDELINQAYQSMACDNWNILWFANMTLGAESFPTLKRLRGEWDELIALGVPAAPVAELSCSEKNIKFLCREVGKRVVVIAVNLEKNALSADFSADWIKPGAQAEVMFESRTMTSEKGTFTDDFAPLARHVYVIDKK